MDADQEWWAEMPTMDHAEQYAARAEMWQALATLPPKQRAVLVLRFYEDYDDRTIGRLLDCSESTVRSNASRATTALRKAWGESTNPEKDRTP